MITTINCCFETPPPIHCNYIYLSFLYPYSLLCLTVMNGLALRALWQRFGPTELTVKKKAPWKQLLRKKPSSSILSVDEIFIEHQFSTLLLAVFLPALLIRFFPTNHAVLSSLEVFKQFHLMFLLAIINKKKRKLCCCLVDQ